MAKQKGWGVERRRLMPLHTLITWTERPNEKQRPWSSRRSALLPPLQCWPQNYIYIAYRDTDKLEYIRVQYRVELKTSVACKILWQVVFKCVFWVSSAKPASKLLKPMHMDPFTSCQTRSVCWNIYSKLSCLKDEALIRMSRPVRTSKNNCLRQLWLVQNCTW